MHLKIFTECLIVNIAPVYWRCTCLFTSPQWSAEHREDWGNKDWGRGCEWGGGRDRGGEWEEGEGAGGWGRGGNTEGTWLGRLEGRLVCHLPPGRVTIFAHLSVRQQHSQLSIKRNILPYRGVLLCDASYFNLKYVLMWYFFLRIWLNMIPKRQSRKPR